MVFRPYWINTARAQTALVGDISLHRHDRGLGQVLLRPRPNTYEHFPHQTGVRHSYGNGLTRTDERRRGFLVFEGSSTLEQTCSIRDLVAYTRLVLSALRILPDERHPCRRHLRRLGFVARCADAVFQGGTCAAERPNAWRVRDARRQGHLTELARLWTRKPL